VGLVDLRIALVERLVTERLLVQRLSPPLLKRWSTPLVHRALAIDQRCRVRAEVEDRGFSALSRDMLTFCKCCRVHLPCAPALLSAPGH
jgi:hypothetical protein